MVEELLKKCSLYNKNSPKFIYKHFKIDENINIKKVERDYVYKFNYIPKKRKLMNDEANNSKSLTSSERNQKRYDKYLNYTKNSIQQLTCRPDDFNEKDYRRLTIFSENYLWVKKFQRRFHKLIVKVLINAELPYLQSTIKNVSYASNANSHKGDKHALIIDMENFFTKIDESRVKKSLKNLLSLDDDIADIYTKLLTSPYDEPPYHQNRYVIGQGLPSSPLLAFLCNSSFFDYLNEICLKKNIKMTIYVDDIVFSSFSPIPQDFINRLFVLFKKNGLSINRKKVARVKNDGVKKITGGYVTQNEVRVKNSKREEIYVIYNELIKKIRNFTTYEEYFDIYNLYLKFTGNYYHLAEVEFKVDNKYIVPLQYSKYYKLIKDFGDVFPRGINKKDNRLPYSKTNIKNEDADKFNRAFQLLLTKKNQL